MGVQDCTSCLKDKEKNQSEDLRTEEQKISSNVIRTLKKLFIHIISIAGLARQNGEKCIQTVELVTLHPNYGYSQGKLNLIRKWRATLKLIRGLNESIQDLQITA